MCAVKINQAVLVGWKMRWHPVNHDTYSPAVHQFDQVHQVLRSAESAGGREIACDLVTPRAVEWMLIDRQELHMRESHISKIFRKLLAKLPVVEPSETLLVLSSPGAGVGLVHRDGAGGGIMGVTIRHPIGIAPFVV